MQVLYTRNYFFDYSEVKLDKIAAMKHFVAS